MKQTEYFEIYGQENKVGKFDKSLYGFKQSLSNNMKILTT